MTPTTPTTAPADIACWLGFDLGGTKMLATVWDSKFKPLGSERRKTKGSKGGQTALERLLETIDEALAQAGRSKQELAGIGMACAGPLDLEKGVLIDAPNLGWKNVPLRTLLEQRFGCPAIIANDVDAGVYGEYRFGAGRGASCVVGAFPGTGIGGGCVYEGRIFRGTRSSCMEIGHIPVVPHGPVCGCGQRGCLEAVASRLAIASAAAAAAYRGAAPVLMRKAGTDVAKIRSGVLRASIDGGDAAVEQIVRGAARQLGVVLAGVIHLLAPEVVVLGGGLVQALPDLYLGEVSKAVKKRIMASYANTFKIVTAELGDDAAVKGAAAWAQQEIRRRTTTGS